MMMAGGLCALHGLFGHLHREIAAPAAASMPEPSLGTDTGGEVVLGAILLCALVVLAAGFRAAVPRAAQPPANSPPHATWRKG
jgi:hypothetical protein